MNRISALALVFCTLCASAAYAADAYPSKPVRIIVPYGAGGIADVTMRLVAEKLSKKFDQQFYIENKPGAGGVVGLQAAKDAAPDGYTLTMIGGGLTIAKSLFNRLPYDLEKDFTPITTTAHYALVLTTKTGSPYKTVKDIVDAAKAKPGSLTFGSINAGSAQNLAAHLMRTMTDKDITVVPYKSTPDLATAVLRGDVDVAFEYYAGFQSPIRDGQMTVIATTGRVRASNLPNVPTVMESGLPTYEVTSWNGLAAPAGTSREIVAALNSAVEEALRSAEVQKYSIDAGMDARGEASGDLAQRIAGDVAKWEKVIATSGLERR